MKHFLFYLFLFCLLTSIGCSSYAQVAFTSISPESPARWNADSLGNIRAVVEFTGTGSVARVIIPWRRSDPRPADKRVLIEDARTAQLITRFRVAVIDHEKGDISFEPISGKGLYYVYYMPYKNEGRSNYPRGVYLPPTSASASAAAASTAAGAAATAAGAADPGPAPAMPNTFTHEIQSIDAFNSPWPMEVIATAGETAALIKKSGRTGYLVFPEDRRYPIKMNDRLPQRWIKNGIVYSYSDTVAKGDNYTWQLGVFALQPIPDLSVQFTDCKDGHGHAIPHQDLYCFNTAGTDYQGIPFTKKVSLETGRVQALWCGADIPTSIPAGVYRGTVTVMAAGMPSTSIAIALHIRDSVETDNGIGEPWKQTRLKWLNSTMMQENSVIAPYTPLTTETDKVHLLGRSLTIGEDGLPSQIQTFFTPEMTGYTDRPNNLLQQAIHFNINDPAGQPIPLIAKGWRFTKKEAGTVEWIAVNTIGSAPVGSVPVASGPVPAASAVLQMDIHARLEFDGFLQYQVRLTALKDVELSDISLLIPFKKEQAQYMMGLGQKGGYTPSTFDWKWQVSTKNQDGAWIGSVNAGLQFSLRDQHYVRPLNTNFYLQKPLLLPTSWGNDNKGGVNITTADSTTLIRNFSGSRTLKKGDSLFYDMTFLITPFHPINTDFQWATRFYHRYNDIDSIRSTGATVINIHHATPINPWINYPFIEYKKMKAYIDEAHQKGIKVKIYNTVRELSDRAYELFPMRSLGHEIYSPGKGGGFSWLQEHVKEDYIPAWFVPEIKDAALVNSGMSRWHNYYVEGMNWLVQNVGIDGIYLDDVAFDRITMKRIKRVLTKDGHPGIIDLHSANQYNKDDGFNNSANLYMEHFPYLNRLWFGEYFDYQNNDPAFFLTEVSGIPFGLMGEMLQDGGNAWRGMIYGMTNRLPWSDGADPRPIWKIWDTFGMQGSEMIGYWSGHCPVTTSNPLVLATVYRKKSDRSALIAIASWAATDTAINLSIDWTQLGIDPNRATIAIPEIEHFQSASSVRSAGSSQSVTSFRLADPLPIGKGKGLILIVKEK
jgi:Family of unknown function (DUF6067)